MDRPRSPSSGEFAARARRLAEQLVVEGEGGRGRPVEAEGGGAAARRLAHAPEPLVVLERSEERRGERRGVAGGNEIAARAALDRLPVPSDVRRDHGKA